MKKISILALLVCLLAVGAAAQTSVIGNVTDGFNESTYANRPTAPLPRQVHIFTDAPSASDCSAGGGATRALCRWTGSAWEALGGGGGVSSLNSLTGALTIAAGGAGNDLNIDATGSIITINIPTASATQRGLLASADFTLFSNSVVKSPSVAQVLQPTADVIGLTVKQFNGTNTAGNIFRVLSKADVCYLCVADDGTVTFGGSGAGSTQWATGAMGVGAASTVKLGAHTGNVLSVSENGGAVTPVLIGTRLTTTGDLWYHDGTGVTRLARGSNGQCLNSTSTTIQWGACGGGGGGASTITVANEGTTGTTLNKLAKLTGAPSTAIIGSTTDTGIAVGIVTAGAGTTGSATITVDGVAACVFDGATTAGNFVTRSGTTAGNCVDAGSTISAAPGVGIIGTVLTTNAAAGTYDVLLKPDLRNIIGTANQIRLAGTAGGGVVFSLPQDIATNSSPSFNTVTASTTLQSPVFRGSAATTSVTFGNNQTATGSSNNGAMTLTSGSNSGSGTTGKITVRSGTHSGTGATADVELFVGDITNASSTATTGNALVQVLNNAGTGPNGFALLEGGGSSNATPGLPGATLLVHKFRDGGTITVNFLQCLVTGSSSVLKVADCGTSATNFVGIALSTTDPVRVQTDGYATVEFDGTYSPLAGWFACSSATTGGKVIPQSTACAAGRQVGIVTDDATSVTSGRIFLQRL